MSEPTDQQHEAARAYSGAVAYVGDERSYFHSRGATAVEILLVIALAAAILIPGIWSYSLVDPWETHYGEVARRMLQDDDWVHTDWQNEGFRSKPVLTFWLIAGSMQATGVGDGGGYSGEMVSSGAVMFAVRLPFVLFGVLGLTMLWWMLARLVNRRVAWLSFLIVITTPFYFFISRQAITDMPLVGCLMGSIACFALAIHSGDQPLRKIWRKVDALHLFLAAMVLFIGWQAFYYWDYFGHRARLGHGVNVWHPEVLLPGAMLIGLAALAVWTLWPRPARTCRQVYMFWFYALVGISVLGKGPPALGIAGAMCFFYLLLTGHWRLLLHLEIPRGILIVALIAVPWHVGMFLTDGRLFLREYFVTHLWRRAAVGVHGDRGTFNFFASQIGIGFWPWVALLPAAIAGVVNNVTASTREGRVRLLIGTWAIFAVGFFALVQTKFHHYIFPAVPALGVMVAFFLDDLLRGRVRRTVMVALAAVVIVLVITRDLMGEQKQFIELFVYRYDRPWPSNEPWSIDLSDGFLGFGLAFAGLMLLLVARPLHRIAVFGLVVVSILFALWGVHVYMPHAGTHWGMRESLKAYYDQRQIHGVDLHYYGLRQLADDWDDVTCKTVPIEGTDPVEQTERCEYRVESYLPEHFTTGQPMTIDITVGRDINRPDREISLAGTVSRFGGHEFWIDLPRQELARLEPHIKQGQGLRAPRQPPWKQVDADRLIAWQLYWRGENFWSGDEIWDRKPEYQTAFKQTDNKAFLAYLEEHGRPGFRYYVVTESGRANGLENILPTPRARDTFEVLDTTSNKFTLVSFVL